MRHGKAHRKLERTASHRRALLRHLVTSLIKHERIETTLPKAKELRRFADRMVTLAKRGDLHARRQAARFVLDTEALRKLFSVLAERFKDRAGGYTRVIRTGFRGGDAAPMGLIEYLGYEPKGEQPKAEKKEKKKQESKPAKAKVAKEPVKKSAKPKAEKKTEKKGFFGRLKKDKGKPASGKG